MRARWAVLICAVACGPSEFDVTLAELDVRRLRWVPIFVGHRRAPAHSIKLGKASLRSEPISIVIDYVGEKKLKPAMIFELLAKGPARFLWTGHLQCAIVLAAVLATTPDNLIVFYVRQW